MKEFTNVTVRVPREFDYELNLVILGMKRDQIKKTKAELIIELAKRGFIKGKENHDCDNK